MENYAELMFHKAVAYLQKADGTYKRYQKMYPRRAQDALSPDDIAFIQSRESVYLATVTPDGWPYVQHRGGGWVSYGLSALRGSPSPTIRATVSSFRRAIFKQTIACRSS